MGAAAALIGGLAVSGQSLWIDEAGTAVLAMQASPLGFLSDRGSTIQMPLYMALLWTWAKIWGSGEFVLRALNIPFLVLGLMVIVKRLKAPPELRLLFGSLILFSPMLWIYLDEARPYVLQFTGALLLLAALHNADWPIGVETLALASAGLVLLAGASLTGALFAFWLGGAFLVRCIRRGNWKDLLRGRPLALLALLAILLTALILYYAWTLSLGARAGTGTVTTPATLAFSLYELLGATGFGPGRLELRENGLRALRPFLGPLALFFGITGLALLAGCRAWMKQRKTARGGALLWIAAPALLGVLSLVAVGWLAPFRVLGRHLIPALPALLFVMAVWLLALWGTRKILVLACLFILAASCVLYRVLPRHAKDDYASAAACARAFLDHGKVVWWAADPSSAAYYHVPLAAPSGPPRSHAALAVFNPSPARLAVFPGPDLVVLSKPDVFDTHKAVSAYLDAHRFGLFKTYPAFRLLVPEPDSPGSRD